MIVVENSIWNLSIIGTPGSRHSIAGVNLNLKCSQERQLYAGERTSRRELRVFEWQGGHMHGAVLYPPS
jgi:hypothetical protein